MIFGHNEQKAILEKIFSHYQNGGFLLFGPEGVGKFGLIKEIAENQTTKDNLIIIQSPFLYSGKESILIKTAELIRNLALLKSLGKRIIIINDAHLFTIQAQNLLLKILEEIPSNTFFFFVTYKPQKILLTIKSRLNPIKFSLVDNGEIKKWLLEQKYKITEINTTLEIFSGQPGLVQKTILEKTKFGLISKFIKENDKISKMLLAEKIIKGMELEEFLKYLILFERINLRQNAKQTLVKLRNLLSLYFDSEFYLNKNIHIRNVCVNYY